MHQEWQFPNPATAPGASSYYSIRFAPPSLRAGLAALHGWRYQVRSVIGGVSDPGVATAKLGWWRDELGLAYQGAGTHPLSHALAPVIARHALPPKPFLDMAWSSEAAALHRWPPDMETLEVCAEQDMGALFELVARCSGVAEPGAILSTRRLGAYCGLVCQIRDSGWLMRKGCFGFVPADRLAETGITTRTLAESEGRRRLPGLLAMVADAARDLRRNTVVAGDLPVTLRIRLRLADLLLAELDAGGFEVADRRISLTPIRKLWHAWRESRR